MRAFTTTRRWRAYSPDKRLNATEEVNEEYVGKRRWTRARAKDQNLGADSDGIYTDSP